MSAELVIRGGKVIDGTGAPAVRADVAIDGGRVVAIGPNLEGEQTLDAGGHVVAPGFIDIHTHYDAQVFWDPALTPSCFHGVTTVVAGNCGFSIAPIRPDHHEVIARTLENVEDMNFETLNAGIPWDFSTFPEYLDSVERRGLGMNFCAYIGHTALRLFVMGDAAYERAATAVEVARMQEVVRDGMRAGAIGFATSFAPTHRGMDGKPIPSRFAERSELEALLEVLSELDTGIVGVTPGEGCSDADLYDLALRTGRPFTYGAILTRPDGLHADAIKLNDEGWRRGAQVWPQVTPRPLVLANTLRPALHLQHAPGVQRAHDGRFRSDAPRTRIRPGARRRGPVWNRWVSTARSGRRFSSTAPVPIPSSWGAHSPISRPSTTSSPVTSCSISLSTNRRSSCASC
jgi:N-acyl-D-amino-acid deacylase